MVMGKELLAPAGNLEKLIMALHYGADAVYLAGEEYGLRAFAGNFSLDDLATGIDLAHRQGKRVYVAVNIFAQNRDLTGLPEYLGRLAGMGADALIVADPGVFALARRHAPNLAVHISTQANITNREAAKFWAGLGAKRLILARELSLAEIQEIRQAVDVELEVFVHGAMCVSYSGRCLLSDYLTGRQANRGECTQPCRWRYALLEETRPGMYLPLEEDGRGSYIFNSRDLCLLADLPALVAAGVDSFKIEGRMKSVHYVATVTQVYRKALDCCLRNPAPHQPFCSQTTGQVELGKVSHRPYTRGFLAGRPGQEPAVSYRRDYTFVGVVRDYDRDGQFAVIEVRNRVQPGDFLEFTGPATPVFFTVVNEIWDENGVPLAQANRPHQLIKLKVPRPLAPLDLVRRPQGGGEEAFLRVRLDPDRVFHLGDVLEGYGHLGVPTTIDKAGGLVVIRTTPDTRKEVIEVLKTLPYPVTLYGD